MKKTMKILMVVSLLFVAGCTSNKKMYQAGKIGNEYLFINLTGKKLYMQASYYHNGKYVMGHRGNKMHQSPNGDDVITIKAHDEAVIKTRPQGKTHGNYKVKTEVVTKLAPHAKTVDKLNM